MVDFNKLTGKVKIEPFVSIDDEEVDIDSIPDQSLTVEQYKSVRANTPGYERLYQKLNPEAFERAVQHCLKNSAWKDPNTYDGALQYVLVPEMLKRLRGGIVNEADYQ